MIKRILRQLKDDSRDTMRSDWSKLSNLWTHSSKGCSAINEAALLIDCDNAGGLREKCMYDGGCIFLHADNVSEITLVEVQQTART